MSQEHEKNHGAELAAGDVDTTVAAPKRQAHTLGPWEVDVTIYEHMRAEIRQNEVQQPIAQVWCGANDWGNAHLIAAAPELLDYAKSEQALADFECPHDVTNARRMCESCGFEWAAMLRKNEQMRAAAIAKAEGRS